MTLDEFMGRVMFICFVRYWLKIMSARNIHTFDI